MHRALLLQRFGAICNFSYSDSLQEMNLKTEMNSLSNCSVYYRLKKKAQFIQFFFEGFANNEDGISSGFNPLTLKRR